MIKEETRFAQSNIFEGMVSIRALINAMDNGITDRRITKVLVDATKAKKRGKELSYIKARSFDLGYDMETISNEEFEMLTVGSSHGGLICITTDRSIPVLDADSDIQPNGFYVMLDGIEDPYNFGYALRSIYAAGANGIILAPRNWMSAAGVVCRASAGASELIPMYTAASPEAAAIFKGKGYSIICADTENSQSIYKTELKYPIFLIVGGEKRGISRQTLDLADRIIRLDYNSSFGMALSAASAASIISFEIMRRNINP